MPNAGDQMQRMFIGPGSAGSLGSFLDPKSTKEEWLHGGKKTRKRAKSLMGKRPKSKKTSRKQPGIFSGLGF